MKPSHNVKTAKDAETGAPIPLRTGQWTIAEIVFSNKVIAYFHIGSLPNCENGATLRALLAELLHCSPMRISKKFAGDGAIGKRTFTKVDVVTSRQLAELKHLELDFHKSIEGGARWPAVEWPTLLLGREPEAPSPGQTLRATTAVEGFGSPEIIERRLEEHQRARGGALDPSGIERQSPSGEYRCDPHHPLSMLSQHSAPITLRRLAMDRELGGSRGQHMQHPQMQQNGDPMRELYSSSSYSPNLLRREQYGWVPSDIGIEQSPATLARMLDLSGSPRLDLGGDVSRSGNGVYAQMLMQQKRPLEGGGVYPSSDGCARSPPELSRSWCSSPLHPSLPPGASPLHLGRSVNDHQRSLAAFSILKESYFAAAAAAAAVQRCADQRGGWHPQHGSSPPPPSRAVGSSGPLERCSDGTGGDPASSPLSQHSATSGNFSPPPPQHPSHVHDSTSSATRSLGNSPFFQSRDFYAPQVGASSSPSTYSPTLYSPHLRDPRQQGPVDSAGRRRQADEDSDDRSRKTYRTDSSNECSPTAQLATLHHGDQRFSPGTVVRRVAEHQHQQMPPPQPPPPPQQLRWSPESLSRGIMMEHRGGEHVGDHQQQQQEQQHRWSPEAVALVGEHQQRWSPEALTRSIALAEHPHHQQQQHQQQPHWLPSPEAHTRGIIMEHHQRQEENQSCWSPETHTHWVSHENARDAEHDRWAPQA